MKRGEAIFMRDFFRDPAPAIRRLRAAGPVVEVRFPIIGRIWTTTTAELTRRVLTDNETFGPRLDGRIAGVGWWMPKPIRSLADTMLTMDEPDHGRLRGIVDEAFRRRAVLEMEPRILELADRLAADLFARGGPADIVDRYARPLPLAVICELLGLPLADWPKFMRWSARVTSIRSAAGIVALVPAMLSLRHYIEDRVATARETGGEGLIAELARAGAHGTTISGPEIVAMVALLLNAGSATTLHLIAGAVYELLRDPALRDWLAEDWGRADLAIEEFLRYVSAVQFTKPRFVRKELDLGGVRLRRGDLIMPMIAAANLDPAANPNPERLDLGRHPNRHLAFGAGIHFCLGHQLARIEAKCALKALLTRWPKLELAVPAAAIRWRKQAGMRAIARLPVEANMSAAVGGGFNPHFNTLAKAATMGLFKR